MDITDLVSESDLPLVDLVSGLVCDITQCFKIFADRNNSRITSALIAATIQSLIEDATGKKCPSMELITFLDSLKDKE